MTPMTLSPAEKQSTAHSVASRPFRLAYLTTEYPKVSHTFIRREILELERRGHHVLRLAIRNSGGAVADAADQIEDAKTYQCLSQSLFTIAGSFLITMLTRPVRWWHALPMTWHMHRRSDRGILAHMAYLAEASLLLRILDRERIEHLHVHFGTNSAAVARLIRALGGPPYSMTVHGPNEFDSPYGFSLGEKVIDASFTIAISGYCAGQIRRWTPHSHWDRIHIVRCTVGQQFFDAYAPVPQESRTLVCVGRLCEQKGQHMLIQAMHILKESGIDLHLILAGDGEMRTEIEAHIAALKLQNHITITGWIDESTVRELVLKSRAMVLPSFAEGLPVVIMEAMAMGRPVISTMIAAIPELVRSNETGWLINAGDLEELVAAMKQVVNTPIDRLNEMGIRARELVLQRHHTNSEMNELERLLDKHIPKQKASQGVAGKEVTQRKSQRAVTCS